jgi:hypothetical protein
MVRWSGPGTFAPDSSLTDAQGLASTTWTLPLTTELQVAAQPSTATPWGRTYSAFYATVLWPGIASITVTPRELTVPLPVPCCTLAALPTVTVVLRDSAGEPIAVGRRPGAPTPRSGCSPCSPAFR